VIRTWLDNEERFEGWYVNLEQPWVRTTVGFDSRDDVLDVTVSVDLGKRSLKDEDELEFAVEVGLLTSDEARSIRATAESAIDDIASRRWPFDQAAWQALRPPAHDQPPALPTGWDKP
jgi:predicted RNA-binding protein associated with RNAse of E/G family